jgi:hypothetical protein
MLAFSLLPLGEGLGKRDLQANRMSNEMYCALLWTGEGTAEHLIPREKNKDNEGKTRQALSPALSQREREFRLPCSTLRRTMTR